MWSEARLQRVWYEGEQPSLGMRLLEPVYSLAAATDRRLWRTCWRRPARLPLPVLVVGNITAGGTGKTPLVVALAQALAGQGWTPGIVSRGHGGSEVGPVVLSGAPDPVRFGDEPCLIRQATGMPVAVGRDRAAAGRLLVEAGVDLVLADDGLQHHALARDVEICVIDGERRFGNGRLLPAGPLREPLARLETVHWRVCNGGRPQSGEIGMQLVGDTAIALASARQQPLSAFAGQRVHAVAGIGNPQRFFDSLRAHGLDVESHAFPDHHAFRPGELDFGDDLPLFMTDKDAVKCRNLHLANTWRVPVRAELPQDFYGQVDARLRQARDRLAGHHPAA